MPDLTQIEKALQALFGEEAIRLAEQSQINQRRSKLNGALLLSILVNGFIQHPTASLNVLAQVAQELGVTVTRQAIHQRMNEALRVFLQGVFQKSVERLQSQCHLPIAILAQFTAVYLLDSSQIALPDGLAQDYPGTGGDGPKRA